MDEKRFNAELDKIAQRIGLEDISQAIYFPKYFEIETIRACNAECKMCTIHEWKDKNNKMDDKLFYKISNEMKDYSKWIKRVCLSRNGEPLMDRGLEEKIKMLKENGIKYTTFSTNASLLTEKRAKSLIDSGLDDIRFSMDGIKKETFESIRKGLKYEKVRDNCLRFIDIRNKYSKTPKIHIRMTLQKANQDEEKDWNNYWGGKVLETDVVSSKSMHSWGNQLNNYEQSNKGNYSGPCVSLWSTMVVHFDGSVPLCGCDYNNKVLLGNINNQKIKNIWHGEKFKEMRNIHSTKGRNEMELCFGCNVWDEDKKKIYNEE